MKKNSLCYPTHRLIKLNKKKAKEDYFFLFYFNPINKLKKDSLVKLPKQGSAADIHIHFFT